MFWLVVHLGNTADSLSSTQEKPLNRHLMVLSPQICVSFGGTGFDFELEHYYWLELLPDWWLHSQQPLLLRNTSSNPWNPLALGNATSCHTPVGQGRCDGCDTHRARADGKDLFILSSVTSFLLFTLGSCCNYSFLKCVHSYFLAGNYCFVLFLWLPLRGRNVQAINGWLFSLKLAPAPAQWLWQLTPFPHQAAALPKAGVWPHVAADVACKNVGHLGVLLPSPQCSADALAGEEVQRVHPSSALFRSWEVLENILTSFFLITVLAENIPRTFFKDTGFENHYAELLKMQAK